MYKWSQLSMCDAPKAEFCVTSKKVGDEVARFLLVRVTDPNGDGYLRSDPVLKADVTDEILQCAGSI